VLAFEAAFAAVITRWDALAMLSGFCSLLPLTVIGFFKPRIAAAGIVLSFVLFLISAAGIARRESVAGGLPILLIWVPQLAVAVLFWLSREKAHR
jgi:hypothetical protein